MPSAARDFGVQSYCFRQFKDNQEVARMVRQIGLNKIELCGVHADFNRLESFKPIVKTYQDAGVSIVSIGVQTFTGKPEERDWFECAKEAGARHISAHFIFDRNGQWNDVVVGSGNLDLPALIHTLEDNKFDGMAVIEYEADADNPVPALARCVESMQQAATKAD